MQQQPVWLTESCGAGTLKPVKSKAKGDGDAPCYPDFGKRLRETMLREGVKTRDVAEELGVDPEAVRLWRAGKRMPKPDSMKKLAKMLGISVAALRDGDVAPEDLMPGALVVTDDDERTLLETYRKLRPWAQTALRRRAAQLLEEFAPKGPENPFGKKSRHSQ